MLPKFRKLPPQPPDPADVLKAMHLLVNCIQWEEWDDALSHAHVIEDGLIAMGFTKSRALLESTKTAYFASIIAHALVETKRGSAYER